MSFIVRQYLVDKLQTHDLKVAFQDNVGFHSVFIRHERFEIHYVIRDTGYIYIKNVEFTSDDKDYQLLFQYEKTLEKILKEYFELNEYLKLKRNK